MDAALDSLILLLNASQKQAVTAPVGSRLCVIAGPGTGKTKVLVSRVAYLLIHYKVAPQCIIVTTFTKKAANEMLSRLRLILEGTGLDIGKLMVGTFHSICYRIIKRYGHLIGLDGHTIADEKDAKQLLEECLDGSEPKEKDKQNTKSYRAKISSLKSRAISAAQYRKQNPNSDLLRIYENYQSRLSDAKLLDFDDCLVKCHDLLVQYPVLNFVKSVLVDEFQDTNEIQLKLMYEFAKGHPTDDAFQNNVLIVGDPDQSIYGFRDAQVKNFESMRLKYEKMGLPCSTVLLDENYRSTSGILDFSEFVMRQQNERTIKNLRSQIPTTFKPVVAELKSQDEEARWIVSQIETLLSLPNQPICPNDIAILFRAAYQTRSVEQELTRKRIPYHMLRGKAFWERKEVVAFVDYLRVVSNENDRLALLRTLNYPKRGIGEKTLEFIDSELRSSTSQLMHQELYDLCLSGKLSVKSKEGLKSYLSLMETCRAHLELYEHTLEKCHLESLMDKLFAGSSLQAEFAADEDKHLNITEVRRQLLEFEPQDESIEVFVGGSEADQKSDEFNHLQRFVHSVGLFETEDSLSSDEKSAKITLSTIHGSKGLEWHTVFVPGLSEGILPATFALTENSELGADEERRCFYVATTRAKTLLYVSSFTEKEEKWGRKPIEQVSRFLAKLRPDMVSELQLAFESKDALASLYTILSRGLDHAFNLDLFKTVYKLKMAEFGDQEPSKMSSGFISARDTKSATFKKPYYDVQKRITSKTVISKVKKAPAYIPPRRITTGPLRAPSYTPNRTMAPKFAPAYIPDKRKAPTYIPNRKQQ